ncbi:MULTISPECIES: hypothetical protein [Pseudomonas]|uniref:hypothetical protein n=1 Tax=Pseudomonas TaxID=286 RepID=UPI00118765CE|nr:MULTISPECIES: hypothetical protein [Pseudomonas]WIN07391.1 hypothetical protein QQF68_00450 [Pseudomonas syringae pv. antirrhini str. 126]
MFFGFSEFSSQSCNFKIWSKDESADDISRTLLDPRNFIRDSTGGALVEHLKFWALRTKPNVLSEAFRVWEEIAIPCSSLIFCTEVWKKNLALNLIFSGPQKLEIEYDQKIDKILFDTLKVVESTSWILDVDREVEIRHNFFLPGLPVRGVELLKLGLSFLIEWHLGCWKIQKMIIRLICITNHPRH